MAMHAAVDDHAVNRSECWCCGAVDDHARMVHLGNHPEVALCVRCGHWAAKQAWEIEDLTRTGPLVVAREGLRAVRRTVVEHGWQDTPLIGRPIRWIGRLLP